MKQRPRRHNEVNNSQAQALMKTYQTLCWFTHSFSVFDSTSAGDRKKSFGEKSDPRPKDDGVLLSTEKTASSDFDVGCNVLISLFFLKF